MRVALMALHWVGHLVVQSVEKLAEWSVAEKVALLADRMVGL